MQDQTFVFEITLRCADDASETEIMDALSEITQRIDLIDLPSRSRVQLAGVSCREIEQMECALSVEEE